jgi:amidase
MKLSEFAAYDGIGLAELIRRRDVTPREVGRCILAGIEICNPRLNAVIETYADAVESLSETPTLAPFYGLPTLTKDFPIEAGRRAEFGSRFAKGYKASYDHGIWSKLKAAGLVNIGRTTTSEFGIAAATESSLYGGTRNPWDLSRGVAGSSGGSAAAVAAGIVPFAQGADGGGSIRTPASFCGVVGLKPSRGRVSGAPESNAPLLGLAISFMLTRTIRDAAALLDITSGAFPGDGYEIVQPPTSYMSAIEAPPRPLRIALCMKSWSGYPIEPDVSNAVVEAGKRLKLYGHTIVEASPEFEYASYLAAQKVIWAAFTAQSLDELSSQLNRPVREDALQKSTFAMYRHGKSLSATSLIEALVVYDQVTRCFGEFFTAFDVLVTPTCPTTPELIGTYDPDRPCRGIDAIFEDLAPKETFSAVFNGTGSPAISLPLGWTKSGLPIGVQMAAAFGSDHLLLSLSAMLETDYQWAKLRPPVHVTNAK